MSEKHTVWITGASSGLGAAVMNSFSEKGWTVIAGARSFCEEHADNVHRFPLDVRDESSVQGFVQSALHISEHVDVLICAAAILVLGSCEQTSADEFSAVMDTNFIGMTRIVSAVLPHMRKQHAGRIVLFSSINGLLGIPFQSAYTASKHAIEGYAECLAMETSPWGIQVCLVEPGDHRGGSDHTRLHASGENADSPYARLYKLGCERIHQDEHAGLLPERLGDKLYRAVSQRRMPFRLRIAKPDQHLAVLLHKLLPARWNASILSHYYQK